MEAKMARWRLNEAHYLNGHPPDLEITEWEYKETDRVNGRERRKRFKVPFYFDAETIVCHEGKGLDGDFIFEGEPTPSMTPIDEEARRISNECREKHPYKWNHPIDSLEGQFSSASMLGSLEKQLQEAIMRIPAAPAPAVSSGVSKEEFEAMKEQLAQLMAQNAELQASPGRRRVE
jgi:hypothetical protein